MQRVIEPVGDRVRIVHGGITVADTTDAVRVIEPSWTAYYVPRRDVLVELGSSSTSTTCSWKGVASYWSLGDARDVAWSYEDPLAEAAALRDHVAFYASRVDELWVGNERVA